MDPATVFSVFLKLAMYLPNEKNIFINKNTDNISRTELIEIYRSELKNKFYIKYNKNQSLN